MRSGHSVIVLVSVVLLVALSGCSRDPNVRKQKYLESGNRYFEKGEYHEATIEFLNAIKLDPRFGQAHSRLAETYIRLQEWTDAYRELKITIELDPSNRKAETELGDLLIAARSFPEAEALIANVLQKDPKNAEAHALRARLYFSENNQEDALPEMEAAIALDANRPDFYVQLAALQSPKHMDLAESTLKRALAIDPNFAPALDSLAIVYEDTGRTAEAENLLKQAIALDSKNWKPRQHLAQLYRLQKRNGDAERVVIQAKKDLRDQADLYRVLGDYYVSNGDLTKAATEYASISKEHPEDIKTKLSYIDLLIRLNRLEEASKLNDQILKANPKDTRAQVQLGHILNQKGQFSDATVVLQAAVKDEPNDAGGRYQLGLALSKTGNLSRAVQEWREAVKLQPHLSEAQMALAQSALLQGDHELLRQSAAQIIEDLPSDPRGYILRADADPDAQEAEKDLNNAIAIAPQSPYGYLAKGGWLARQGKFQDAQKFYEQALDRDPNQFDALNAIVAVFVHQKQIDKAIQRVEQQIAKVPSNDSFYALAGSLQATNKDFPAAEASLQKAIALNKNNLGAFLLFSNIERSQGATDKALSIAYQSIEQNPKNVSGYFLAGSLEESLGNRQKSEQLYRQALQIEPTYAPAANNLAYLMLENGENLDEALSLAQIARQKMPESAGAADTLGWIYYRKGLYSFAAALLREALQKAPDSATYHYHLGMVYQKQNNTAEARKHLQRALQINPNLPAATEIRQTLSHLS